EVWILAEKSAEMEGEPTRCHPLLLHIHKGGKPAERNHRKHASDPGVEAFMCPLTEQRRSAQSASVVRSV
ncbi:hypothetical protein GOODEAATRI_020985, partial [Goodea atripinnis]